MAALNPAKPQHVWDLTFEGDWPTSVAFIGGSRKLAAGNREGKIYLWDIPDAPPENPDLNKGGRKRERPDLDPVRLLEGHQNGITHLISTADGNTLISASLDHSVRLWNTNLAPEGKVEAVLDMDYRRQQTRRKSEEETKKILEAPGIEVEVQRTHETLAGHADWITALNLSADERRLISGDDDCLTIVWDLPARKEISRWTGYPRDWIRSVALSPDGKTAFVCEHANKADSFDVPAPRVRLWNADDGTPTLDLLKLWTPETKDEQRTDSYGYAQTWGKLLKDGLVCAAWSPDGKLIAAGQGGEIGGGVGNVHLIDAESGKIVRTVSEHHEGVVDVKFSADGKYLLTAGRDTVVKIIQVEDGKDVATLGKGRGGQFKDWIHAIALSADEQWLAMADISGIVQVWRFE
ncbi:MAG: hypothetical protein WD069_14925 [Planctomycetales bacterium]